MSEQETKKPNNEIPDFIKENRVKGLHMSYRAFVDIFSTDKAITFETDEGILKDSIVLGVSDDFRMGAFLIRIANPKFDPVPEGSMIPFIEGQIKVSECNCNNESDETKN